MSGIGRCDYATEYGQCPNPWEYVYTRQVDPDVDRVTIARVCEEHLMSPQHGWVLSRA